MVIQILVDTGGAPLPLGPREMDATPHLEDLIWAEIEGKRRQLRVVAVQHLPLVPSGTFKHDQVWVICQLV